MALSLQADILDVLHEEFGVEYDINEPWQNILPPPPPNPQAEEGAGGGGSADLDTENGAHLQPRHGWCCAQVLPCLLGCCCRQPRAYVCH